MQQLYDSKHMKYIQDYLFNFLSVRQVRLLTVRSSADSCLYHAVHLQRRGHPAAGLECPGRRHQEHGC